MATTSPVIKEEAAIPFWRDVRVLGVLGQIVVTALVLLGVGWLVSNFITNAENQGLEIGFGFLNVTAAFDIKEGINYDSTDTFGRALWVGVTNTIRVALLGMILTTFLGILVGIARLSNNWLISKIAMVYIELIRNVPLLVLLFFLYFGVVLKLPAVKDSIQPFGLPLYLNQRGVALLGVTATSGFPIWLAFIVLAAILVMALWIIQSRQEEKSGVAVNKFGTAAIAFLIVVFVGWMVITAFITNQAIMVTASRNIEEFKDFETFYLLQIDNDALGDLGVERATLEDLDSAAGIAAYKAKLNAQLAAGASAAEVEAIEAQLTVLNVGSITVCAVEDTTGAINAASQLRRQGIPVKVKGENSMTKAGANYAAGDCDLLAGSQAELAAERSILEAPGTHELVPVSMTPLIVNTPAPAGFNIQGGASLSPEFFALLIGLVIYTATYAAEIVRAGILSVSKGQSEAASALGLTDGQRLRLIILPQAMRVIIPPMTSQYLNLTKNSSLGVAIAFPELVSIGNTVMNQSGFAIQVILVFMASYLTISLLISAFLNWYNKKVALVER